ncbi:MAG: ABC transporter permease subunit [Candidatus Verstraetearchaeota archaeon]|nr:ABC transporter permease subunit [Candidatus Verstraetearchaeota archaeon]
MAEGFARALQILLSGDQGILEITLLSLRVSLAATLLGAAFGIPIGFLVARKDFRGRSVVTTVINTLMGLPPVVVGLVVYLFLSVSGPLGFLRLLYTPEAMIIAQMILTFPVVCGITISSVLSLNPKLKETLVSLSAPPSWEARVLLNESKLGLITAIIAAFGAAISEVGAIMMVGGNLLGYTRALTTAIMLYTNMGEFATAIALGIILLLIAFGVNLFLTYLQMRSRVRRTT